jgi:hypothetical protein
VFSRDRAKGDETISNTVGDHSRDQALSPKRHVCQRLHFIPTQFLPRDASAASDADKCNGETHPQESSENETKLQEGPSMLCALRIALRDWCLTMSTSASGNRIDKKPRAGPDLSRSLGTIDIYCSVARRKKLSPSSNLSGTVQQRSDLDR